MAAQTINYGGFRIVVKVKGECRYSVVRDGARFRTLDDAKAYVDWANKMANR